MIKKTLATIKNNPIIFVLMVVFMLLMAVLSIPVISETNKMTANYSNIYNFSNINPDIYRRDMSVVNIYMQRMLEIRISCMKILLYSLVLLFLQICFISGYGNMVEAAMKEGKASMKIFFYGIRKFLGKVLLSALLLAAIIIGFSVLVSLITIPLTIISVLSGSFTADNILAGQKTMQIFISFIVILLYPLLLLWLPAIFTDRKDGVIKCFKSGFTEGKRQYVQVLPASVLMMQPGILQYLLSDSLYELIKSPYYLLIYPIQGIILSFVITYLFVLYHAVRYGGPKTCP